MAKRAAGAPSWGAGGCARCMSSLTASINNQFPFDKIRSGLDSNSTSSNKLMPLCTNSALVERLRSVTLEVLNIFNANREANESVRNVSLLACLARNLQQEPST